jgi:hypothetical protein
MSEKTAMQELIQFLNPDYSDEMDVVLNPEKYHPEDVKIANRVVAVLTSAYNKAQSLLAFASLSTESRWVRGRDKLPSLFKSVKWRNADGGNIPLPDATPLELYERCGVGIERMEWFDDKAASLSTDAIGWRKVENGLPDPIKKGFNSHMTTYVQVYILGENDYETGVGSGRYCYERKAWFATLYNYFTPPVPNVTHWMPLPNSPVNKE